MRHLIFILALSIFSIKSMGQSSEEIVQKQLDFYNNRNIEGFMSLFANDAMLVNQTDGKVLAEGKEAVREIYTNLFEKSPNLKSVLKNRMVLGNTVIDHENITGRMGNSEAIELIVIYEIRAEKIFRCTVIRGNSDQ
ncbi:nuclear transport factor 2 family protein [Ekhidna sp.]